MKKWLRLFASGIFLSIGLIILVAGCTSNYISAMANDRRTDDEIANLLPPDVLAQTEFPRAYVIETTRECISGILKSKSLLFKNASQVDNYCSCFEEKMVTQFTLAEYIGAAKVRWDPKDFPEQAKKKNDAIAACTKRIFQ